MLKVGLTREIRLAIMAALEFSHSQVWKALLQGGSSDLSLKSNPPLPFVDTFYITNSLATSNLQWWDSLRLKHWRCDGRLVPHIIA